MNALPEYWRRTRPRPARPPVNWHAIGMSFGLGVVASLLILAGAVLVGCGAGWLGGTATAAGVATCVAASFVRV